MSARGILATPQLIQVCGIIQNAYSSSQNQAIPVEVPIWKKILEERLSKQGKAFSINIQFFPPQGSQIRGALNRYVTKADIFVSDKEKLPWQRYIATKELAHLLIDTPDQFTHRPSSLMEQLISGIPLWLLRKDHTQEDAAFESEKTAMIAAIEMLLPWKHRSHVQKRCHQGKNNAEIAEEFNVPEYVVSNLLTPTYYAASQNANMFVSENLLAKQ